MSVRRLLYQEIFWTECLFILRNTQTAESNSNHRCGDLQQVLVTVTLRHVPGFY